MKAHCIGNGQVHQLYLGEKVGALNCMSDQQKILIGGGCEINGISTSRNKVLRVLREAYGEEATFQWGVAILEALQQAEILRQGVHEGGIPSKAENWAKLDGDPSHSPDIVADWLLRDMRKQQKRGCSPQGWKPAQQRFEQPTESMPELPHQDPSSAQDLFDMWGKGEGLWLLRQALSEIQEIRRPIDGSEGGDGMNDVRTTVRRLTPL